MNKDLPKSCEKQALHPGIAIWIFIFSLVLFFSHTSELIGGEQLFKRGYLATDFFLYIAGYYLADRIRTDAIRGVRTPTDRFMLNVLSLFYKAVIAAFIIGFLYTKITEKTTFPIAIKDLLLSTHEIGLSRMYGLNVLPDFNVPTWFFSALLISFVLLYPLGVKYQRPFFTVACPVIALCCYAFLVQKFASIDVKEEASLGGFILAGLLRTIAAVSLGMFLNECCFTVRERGFHPSVIASIIFCICEILCLVLIFFYFNIAKEYHWSKKTDFIIAFIILLFCFLVLSGLTGFKTLFRSDRFFVLAEIALYLFLSFGIAEKIVLTVCTKEDPGRNLAIYAILTIAVMLLCRVLVLLFDLFEKKVLPGIKSIMFEQTT